MGGSRHWNLLPKARLCNRIWLPEGPPKNSQSTRVCFRGIWGPVLAFRCHSGQTCVAEQRSCPREVRAALCRRQQRSPGICSALLGGGGQCWERELLRAACPTRGWTRGSAEVPPAPAVAQHWVSGTRALLVGWGSWGNLALWTLKTCQDLAEGPSGPSAGCSVCVSVGECASRGGGRGWCNGWFAGDGDTWGALRPDFAAGRGNGVLEELSVLERLWWLVGGFSHHSLKDTYGASEFQFIFRSYFFMGFSRPVLGEENIVFCVGI